MGKEPIAMAIWTMRLAPTVPKGAAEEIEALLDQSEHLDQFVNAGRSQAVALTPSDVIASISKQVGVSADILRKVFNALENLRNLAEEFGAPEKMLDDLILHLDEGISTKLKQKKEAIARAVREYGQDNAVSLSYKAQRITYMRENIYQQAEIITDARPVFDEKGENVVEYLITHNMVVTYFRNGRGAENVHLAMDAADVLKLRKACDRAVVKAKALKRELGDRARILRDDDANS
jgi:hypothetical protein